MLPLFHQKSVFIVALNDLSLLGGHDRRRRDILIHNALMSVGSFTPLLLRLVLNIPLTIASAFCRGDLFFLS
jgi:hypothetical protein